MGTRYLGDELEISHDVHIEDNGVLKIGSASGGDLQLYHNASHSLISNQTGDLFIRNQTNDGDIKFQADDGSGGDAEYFRLDGGGALTIFSKHAQFVDNATLILGTSTDFQAYHNGTHTYLLNDTGNLEIQQRVDNGDIVFKCDDGSGGVAEYIRIDGGAERNIFSKDISLTDSVKLMLGSSNDLQLFHDGSNTLVENYVGNLTFEQRTDDADMIFKCDNGSGGTTAYLTLDGSEEAVVFGKAPHIPEYILHVGDGNTFFGFAADDTFRVGVGGTTRLNIATGIELTGNTTLTGALSITGDGSNAATLTETGSGTLTVATADDFVVDSAVDITLDAAGNDIRLKSAGTSFGTFTKSGNHFFITSNVQDGDIKFSGNDNGSSVTALILDMSDAGTASFNHDIKLADNGRIKLGDAGNDLEISHSGTNSFIENNTGSLIFIQHVDDGDMIFQADDGSGGDTEYFRLDGGVGYMIASKAIRALDSVNLQLGASADLTLQHNGTDSQITNYTGNLQFTNVADDKDITFATDDGSGGDTIYITLDGSATNIKVSQNLYVEDGYLLSAGSGLDLRLKHDGTDSFMFNETGDLYIQNKADDKDIIFQCDDGSGGVETYFFLDGSSGSSQARTVFPDDSRLCIGTGQDLNISHEAGHSYIQNTTGDLYIKQRTDDGDLIFQCDDGSGGDATYFQLDGSAVENVFSKDVRIIDNEKLMIGSGQDTYVYHNGSNTYFDNYTGDLYFRQEAADKDIIFQCDDGSGSIETYFFLDGSISSGNPFTVFPDNSHLAFGDSQDLQIDHDGNHSVIYNKTGHLYISNDSDDGDIILRSDDGSGGVTAYLTLDGSTKTVDVDVPIEINDQMLLGSKQAYTLPAQGTRMRLLQIADNTLCRVYLESSENSYHQPIVLDIFYRAQYTTSKPQIVRSESYEWHAHSNDIIFTSDQAGTAGADSYIYAEKVAYSTGRNVNIRKIEVFDGTLTVLDGSTTDTNGGTDETIVSTFAEVNIGDSDFLNIGDGNDLQLYHTGSDSRIANGVGNLEIINNANDKDIIFKTDDGSGGNTAYLTLDGSAGYTTVQKQIRLEDSVEFRLGDSGDAYAVHNGSNFFLVNDTGDLTIKNSANDKDIIFQCDDHSGGTATYFFLDGSTTSELTTTFPDNSMAAFGTGNDLRLWHDGSTSYVNNYNGTFKFYQHVDDGDMIFYCDDGSGGATPYITLDGGEGHTVASKEINFSDGIPATFGNKAGGDLEIKEQSGNSYISNFTGNLEIVNHANDSDIIFKSDDGSGNTTTYFRLDGSHTETVFSQPIRFDDSEQLKFGASSDLQLYHNGSHSYIAHGGTGNLYIQQTTDDADIIFTCDDGSGGNGTYLTLDGSEEKVVVNKPSQRTFEVSDASTHGDANGDIVYFGGTTSMSAGKIYHYKANGTWELADADAASTSDGLLAVAIGAASDTNGMLLRGMVTLDHDPGNLGDVLFLSTTAGEATGTAPSGSGDIVRVVGYLLGGAHGQIYFNPDGAFVEVA